MRLTLVLLAILTIFFRPTAATAGKVQYDFLDIYLLVGWDMPSEGTIAQVTGVWDVEEPYFHEPTGHVVAECYIGWTNKPFADEIPLDDRGQPMVWFEGQLMAEYEVRDRLRPVCNAELDKRQADTVASFFMLQCRSEKIRCN